MNGQESVEQVSYKCNDNIVQSLYVNNRSPAYNLKGR